MKRPYGSKKYNFKNVLMYLGDAGHRAIFNDLAYYLGAVILNFY